VCFRLYFYGHPILLRRNILEFKSRDHDETTITTDNYRILFMGDSFTEGVGVEYDQTFFGEIANEYADFNIDALKAGVVGYSPNAYYRKTKHLLTDIGLKVNELIVFIEISDILDEVNTYSNVNEIDQDVKPLDTSSQNYR
jgi:hypothetical protein